MSGADGKLEDKLIYRPGTGDDRKHCFDQAFFASEKCKQMSKVFVDDCVEMKAHEGQQLLFAKSAIKKGQVVEKSVLRACDGLPDKDKQANPFILRNGPDFSIEGVELELDAPYLAAGAIMFYATTGDGEQAPNVELKVSAPNGPSSIEVDVVALVDIEAGVKLVRKGENIPVDTKFADVYDMPDSDLDAWFAMWGANDIEDAAGANKEPEKLHEATLREHFRKSRAGEIPYYDTTKARVIPHPVWPGYGVFATVDIKEGEIVEYGLHRKIAGLNGDKCPYVFTWNSTGRRRTQEEGPNQWGQGAGQIMFYNSDSPANCRLFRLYGGWRFVLVARRDIAMGEELMHLYKSSSWRKCFVEDSYLPKEQPLEVRSRANSAASDAAVSPELAPQADPNIMLNDGTRPRSTPQTSPSFEPDKDPVGPADDLKL